MIRDKSRIHPRPTSVWTGYPADTMDLFDDFFQLHFANQEEPYSSHIIFAVKEACGFFIRTDKFLNTKFVRKYYNGENDISSFQRQERYLDACRRQAGGQYDHYITPNGFIKYNNRQKENLQSIHNIVLDFDCHRPDHELKTKDNDDLLKSDNQFYRQIFDAVMYWMKTEAASDPSLVLPGTLVFTGRGVQMWYPIKPVAAGMGSLVRALVRRLLESWQEFFSGYPFTENLRADWNASLNLNGLMRLPGTWNSKTRECGSFCILSREVREIHDLMEAAGMVSLPAGEKGKKKTTGEKTGKNRKKTAENGTRKREKTSPAIPRNGALDRISGLKRLAELRIQSGEYTGCRDLLCFFMYLSCQWAGYPQEECLEQAHQMNRMFPVPLKERELETYLSSAKKKRYLYRNRTIIDRLRITEQEQILTGIRGLTKREQLSSLRKEKKQKRDESIIRLWKEGNMPKRRIAREAGCSVPTVYKVIREYEAAMERQKESPGTEMNADTGRMPVYPRPGKMPCIGGFPHMEAMLSG